MAAHWKSNRAAISFYGEIRMKCPNCAAPLPAGKSACRYCGETADVDFAGLHHDPTQIPDEVRNCPGCQNPMETVNVATPEEPVFIERCPDCLGLFFDPGELDLLVDRSVQEVYSIDRLALSFLMEHNTQSQIQYRKCPRCKKCMNRVNYGQSSGVVIDQCRDHGIFLDAGELRRIVTWVKSGGRLAAANRVAANEARPSSDVALPLFQDVDESPIPGLPRIAAFLAKLLSVRVR
jgi:Zn-finger nucleic acid-binding protein